MQTTPLLSIQLVSLASRDSEGNAFLERQELRVSIQLVSLASRDQKISEYLDTIDLFPFN